MHKNLFIDINKKLNKFMGILTPTGVILGLFLGHRITGFKPIVIYLFAFVTFSGALGMKFSDFLYLKEKPSVVAITIAITHILMPLIILFFTNMLFPNKPNTIIGFILLYSNPIAVVSYIWSSIHKGNDILSLSLVLLSTLLAPIVTPLTMNLLTNTEIVIDTAGIMISLLYMVVLPCIAGVIINTLSQDKAKMELNPYLKPFTKLALLIVAMINASQVSGKLTLSFSLLGISIVNIVFSFMGFILGFVIAKLFKFTKEDLVSVSYAVGLRNISAALVLAVNFFPAESSVPVLIGITIQQIIAALFGYFILSNQSDNSLNAVIE